MATKKTATRKPAKRTAVAKKTATRKPAKRTAVAKKTAARKPATRTPVAKKTAARKPAKRTPVAKKTAARKPAKRTAVAKKTAAGTGRGGDDGGGRIRIGDRIVVEAVKVGRAPRAGAVTHVAGTMIRVRWDDGNESSLVPASGSLRVARRARERLGKRH